MRATTIDIAIPVSVRVPGRRRARTVRLDTMPALAFEHVAYHRDAVDVTGRETGMWTVTHRESALAVARNLPSRAAARDLALTLERDVTAWPTRHEDTACWVGVDDLAQTLRRWRIRTTDGHDLARTLRRRNSVASA